MKLSSVAIDRLVAVLEACEAVPMPGGHGTWFADVRARYPDLTDAPGTAARCYVCLILLGDGEGEQRWNPKEWWPHALAWFDIYCPEIAKSLDAPRWSYLLAAMLALFDKWSGRIPEARHLMAYASDCHRRAETRLTAMTRGAAGSLTLSAPIAGRTGTTLDKADEQWRRAALILEGPDADRLELLYLLHAFHSSLGIAQHSLDERYASRLPFYTQMRLCLAHGFAGNAALADCAARLDDALARTVLLDRAGMGGVANGALADGLPACFQLAHHASRPPIRAVVQRRLADHPDACCRLLVVHDLAVALADAAMDFFRAGGEADPGFRRSAFDYLHSVVRYGPKMFEQQKALGTLPAADPDMPGDRPATGRPMTRVFADRMRSGLLADPARARLETDLRPFLPTHGAIARSQAARQPASH